MALAETLQSAPWLLTACVLAVLCLAWHFARAFRATPWDAP